MHDLTAFTRASDLHEYVKRLWSTPDFRTNHEDEGFIHVIVQKMAEKGPVLFFSMDDPDVEWSQFTTWMGALARRPDYENDAIHDLYYLHEFVHMATMEYNPDLSFAAWHRKMCENEMMASVHSECYAYFELPDLRAKSFDFEIWVDRHLSDEDEDDFVDQVLGSLQGKPSRIESNEDRKNMVGFLIRARKEAMTTPDPFDFLEMQIHYYAMQNVQWSNIWSDNFREVESHMAEYLEHAQDNPSDAVDAHIIWLQDKMGDGVTPYQPEAEAFAQVVKANKKRQGNDILRS